MSYVWPHYGQSIYTMSDMTNVYNLAYLGQIFVGTNAQEFAVIWDTGSGSYLGRSTYCTTCDAATRKFDYSKSSTWSKQSPTKTKTVTYMDGTSLKGYYGTDRVCPTNVVGSCTNDFKFIAISEATGLKSYEDGIIGLWSGNTNSISYDKTMMFVPEMVTDSTITDKVFSWYMSGKAGKTYIDFGTPNSSIYDNAKLIYIPIKDNNYWWTNSITGVRWTKNSANRVEYKYTSSNALTDTGSSCIIGPAAMVDYFKNTILNTIPKVETHSSWDYQFDCSDAPTSSMPSFELLYGGYWFEVLPEDYIIEFNSSSKKCAVCLTAYSTIDYWILGDAFMRNLYSIHDYTNKKMGFVPYTGSVKTAPTLATSQPTTSPPNITVNIEMLIFGLTVMEFIIVAVIVAVIVGVVVLVVILCTVMNKQLKASSQ